MFRTFVNEADHIPPIKVILIKVIALTSIPVLKSKTSGMIACRILPPAIYCSEIITNWITIWQNTPKITAFVPWCRSISSEIVVMFCSRYFFAIKIPITIAPIAQAIVYQPADKPTLKACSETPIVEAPPTARPMIVTAISGADNLRPASA